MAEQQITLKKQRLPFTQVPNELLCSDKISGMAKALWCVLYSKPENWTFYWSEISKNFKEGREALMTARNHLEESGYIKITQKRIPTGKGKETRYGGMDIELFHTPGLEPEQSSQTTGFPTTGLPTSGNQQSGDQISGDESSGNPPLDRNKSKQDLSKKYLSYLSLPSEEKKEFLKKIFLDKKLKSDSEKYFLFREKNNWKGVSNLEADISWWENGHKEKFPELHVEKPTTEKSSAVEEPKEIQNLRKEIKSLISRAGDMQHYEFFIGKAIEEISSGYVIKVSDERALRYEELLKQIKVKIEMV